MFPVGRPVSVQRFYDESPGKRVVGGVLHLAGDAGVPKLTAGARYLQEQLNAYGVKVLLSEPCLKDFVRNATEAVAQTLKPSESYIACLCRHLDARARFILLWTSSDEFYDRAVWRDLVALAQTHALPRAGTPAHKFSHA
jgi:hypothetical protein